MMSSISEKNTNNLSNREKNEKSYIHSEYYTLFTIDNFKAISGK